MQCVSYNTGVEQKDYATWVLNCNRENADKIMELHMSVDLLYEESSKLCFIWTFSDGDM